MTWSGRIAILLLITISFYSCSEKPVVYPEVANYDVVPKPQQLDSMEGFFHLNNAVEITIPDSTLTNEKDLLETFVKEKLNIDLGTRKSARRITLSIDSTDLSNELYSIEITEKTINIIGVSSISVARGVATLKQLILLNSVGENHFVPCAKINDYPIFSHRGMLLDCSRHFFSKDVIKKYIDLLALYKMNTLHWHLTEDQGWRLAIDKYPKLTEVAAFRTELDGSEYGGFYTKEDIKEIVAYATERHIDIIPEIELPGHSQAAIAAYPHLSCTGKQVEVANDWGVFKDIYCAGNDSVFTFLEDVLTEVVELFPSPYIHIGGDEAPKVRWEKCAKCQKRIKDHNLKDEHELQSYFIKRIQTFLKTKNKEIIGWDEILEGGLAEGAIVQSWRGVEGGIEAVKHGNKAIMSPTSHAYFDYDLKSIDLEKVYSFNPIPEGLSREEAGLIIGGECNLWSERIPDEANLDSKVFPRMLAMSEVLWSYPAERNYEVFNTRVQSQYSILDAYNVKYGEETIPLTTSLKLEGDKVFIELIPSSDEVELHYKWECNECQKGFKIYQTELEINQRGKLHVQPFKNDKKYGEELSIPFEYHSAINDSVVYENEYSEYYTAGGNKGLVDSKLGTLDFRDGAWQGFYGKDLECVIDLEEVKKNIFAVSSNFYQYNNSWIFIPKEYTVHLSMDGENWELFGVGGGQLKPEERGQFIETIGVSNDQMRRFDARYIKVHVKNIGKVPDWHEASGSDAWIFIDEVAVKTESDLPKTNDLIVK